MRNQTAKQWESLVVEMCFAKAQSRAREIASREKPKKALEKVKQ